MHSRISLFVSLKIIHLDYSLTNEIFSQIYGTIV